MKAVAHIRLPRAGEGRFASRAATLTVRPYAGSN